MQTLEEIAREIAERYAPLLLHGVVRGSPALEAAIRSALIEADAAATERAAKVAERFVKRWMDVDEYDDWNLGANARAEDIATAIRNQEPSDA